MAQASTSPICLHERLAALPQADSDRLKQAIETAFAPLRRFTAKASRLFTPAARKTLLVRTAREGAAQRRTAASRGRRPRTTTACARRANAIGDDPGDNDDERDDHGAHHMLVSAGGHR